MSTRVLTKLGIAVAVFCSGLAAAPARAEGTGEFRAFWADAFHFGYRTPAEVDTMIDYAVQGRYNAIILEVLAYAGKSGSAAHGAFWKSSIVPWANAVTDSFDPLAYACEKAHAHGIEMHAWLYPFRATAAWPATLGAAVPTSGQWLMGSRANMGTGPTQMVTGQYWFDIASSDVQEYYLQMVRELVGGYPIDGIHWDYELSGSGPGGTSPKDNWFPADINYVNSGVARYMRLYGTTDVPATNNANWASFRLRAVNEFFRRCQAEMQAVTSNPRQPLRHTASLMAYGSAPATCANFTSTSSYIYFGDYATWMKNGWLDAGIPMVYKRENDATQKTDYRNWVDRFLSCWRGDRHVYIGQASYLNASFADSVTQMQYALDQVDGVVNYSYWVTRYNNQNDTTWYTSYLPTNLFTETVATPHMDWRDPATATEGMIWGRVTDANTGLPVDDATVQVDAGSAVQTDGNGYYVVTRVPATGAGGMHAVLVSKTGLGNNLYRTLVTPAGLTRQDITLPQEPPTALSASISVRPLRTSGIILNAADDGHPDLPAKLSYVLTSLPTSGTLVDAAGNPLALGEALPDSTPQVYYRAGSIVLQDSFTFMVNDGWADSGIATMSVRVEGAIAELSPATLVFTSDGTTGVDLSDSFAVRNAGSETLHYTLVAPLQDWITSVSPMSGSCAAGAIGPSHTVTCRTQALAEGIYGALVQVVPDYALPDDAPIQVQVFLDVRKPGQPPWDPDLDGVTYLLDNCPNLANADQQDTDGDGIGNACDNCPAAVNANQSDQDGDGEGDACDNCVDLANSDQGDADADGWGDACDLCPAQSNELAMDRDGDGIGDGCDNCMSLANADQTDVDKDGIGDACDICPASANADQADADGDGVGDVCDNCPAAVNVDQKNGDEDAWGDACDLCAAHADTTAADQDNDAVGDACDNCPAVANANQADADADGIGDACETPVDDGDDDGGDDGGNDDGGNDDGGNDDGGNDDGGNDDGGSDDGGTDTPDDSGSPIPSFLSSCGATISEAMLAAVGMALIGAAGPGRRRR